MDNAGTVLDERRIKNIYIKEYLEEKIPHQTHAILEATRYRAFMYDILDQHVDKVSLAHPKELKAIATAAVKTDQIDAKVLAHLARLNFLPTSYALRKRYVTFVWFSVTETGSFGQQDASQSLQGGEFSLNGGFWGFRSLFERIFLPLISRSP